MYWMDEIVSPSESALSAEYGAISAQLDGAQSVPAWRDGFGRWDTARRGWQSWANVTRLRYTQDTRRDDYRDAQAALDRRSPGVASLDTAMKQRFLMSAARPALEAELGVQAFALWSADVTTFDDAIAPELVRESELKRQYTELLACANVTFEGEQRSLGDLGTALQDSERERRHAAQRALWSAYSERSERLDSIFDELVRTRDGMARKLGFENYTGLGYRRMQRVDYGPEDVARYRDEVARVVVPFAHELVRKHGARAGVDRVYFWDESSLGSDESSRSLGDPAWILGRTQEALEAMDPELGSFARAMIGNELFDVENRPGKALGAYCTNFPTRRVPFVFGNFNGSRADVRMLMHELGHAFQAWKSRDLAAVDYLIPTYESAEIHSMSLEYLSWPQMDRFFGGDASAYRREHLLDAMLFLPYGVAVDHFQHLVYAHPAATPAERHEMWQEVERRYLPWRDYGDLEHPNRGGLWQEKRHIYIAPFYYIDYTLALCCALQFWVKAASDRDATLESYVALCARGGEAPFRELVRSAGLRVPFEAGALQDVITAASAMF
jgi:M3 family oligoendopeptidase